MSGLFFTVRCDVKHSSLYFLTDRFAGDLNSYLYLIHLISLMETNHISDLIHHIWPG